MAAIPSKRKLNQSSDSKTETPISKRPHACLSDTDTSETSDMSDKLIIDLSYVATSSPVNGPVTNSPARQKSPVRERNINMSRNKLPGNHISCLIRARTFVIYGSIDRCC